MIVWPAASTGNETRFAMAWRRLPVSARMAAIIICAYAVIAVTGPLWAPYSPTQTALAAPFESFSFAHLFGTDLLGRDVFSRVVYGTRYVFLLSFSSATLAVAVGGCIGLFCGYVGGLVDSVVMRAFEAVISIPLLILALLAILAAGPQLSGDPLLLMAIVVLVYGPRTARIVRAAAVDLATRDFVTVARARGESDWSITWREIAPNAIGVLLVELGVRAGSAPLLISSLGFLGFGLRPPTPDWGLMIGENRSGIVSAPLAVLGPCLALATLVISVNLITERAARLLGRSAEPTS